MPLSSSRNNLIGIVSLCAGALVFSVQDAVIKLISGDHAVTLAIVLRAIVSFPILIVMLAFAGGIAQLNTPKWPLLVVRGAILLCAYTSYFMAFPALPLAEAIALYFMVPIFVTLMSGPFLGEPVGWKAWVAVIVGLVGVFVILEPGSGLFEPAALLTLISAATYSYAMILARQYGSDVPSTVMAFYGNAVYWLVAMAFATAVTLFDVQPPGHPSLDFLVRQWAVPSTRDMALMALCGVIAAFGSVFLVHAYRIGTAAIVAPFEYTGMIWAVVFGYYMFSEIPKWNTFLGMLLIAAAGIIALNAGARKAG